MKKRVSCAAGEFKGDVKTGKVFINWLFVVCLSLIIHVLIGWFYKTLKCNFKVPLK